MPIITQQICGLPGLSAEYDINDANMRVSQIRVYNDSDHYAKINVTESGSDVFTQYIAPHSSRSWNTSGIQLVKPPVTSDDPNPGISYGDYEISVVIPSENPP